LGSVEAGLLSVGMISILAYLPLMCYLDLKDRKVPVGLFASLLIINVPITALVYALGWLSLWHLLSSLMICVFAFAIWKWFGSGAFSAADRNLLMCIALFFYWNPFQQYMDIQYANFIAATYQEMFLVYFIMVMCMVPLCVFALNLGIKNQNEYNVWEMITKVPRGIPMIIPIAAAFMVTILWGI
jgi:hypothetical protein